MLSFVACCAWAVIPARAANDIAECRTIADATARLRCYESLVPPSFAPSTAGPSATGPLSIGRWKLVRTPNPRGGKEAVSIIRTGELSGSDQDFAGLVLRCGDVDIEALVILVKALPFRARPRVFVGGQTFEATVAPPGSAVLLPPEAAISARQAWPSLKSLAIEVASEGVVTRGLVLLDDLSPAIDALNAACALRP